MAFIDRYSLCEIHEKCEVNDIGTANCAPYSIVSAGSTISVFTISDLAARSNASPEKSSWHSERCSASASSGIELDEMRGDGGDPRFVHRD